MRVAARTLGRAAMFAVAFSPLIWTAGSAVAADNSAAHALAEKFSRAEDAERAEAAKKAEAKKKAEAEKARAEAQRQAERRKASVDQRAKDEAEMQEAARQEAEARRAADQRAAEERARIETEQDAARADAARLAQEAEQRRSEDDRKAEEARQAEAARLAKDVEEKRLADERKAEEARQAEAARQAEERKAEDARIAKEAEEKRLGEEHRAARLAKEAEDKRRAEAAKKAEEQRQADAAREALERQRTEEAERVAQKFRLAREAREARLAREREQAARNNGTDTGNSDTRNSLGGPGPDATSPIAPWDATDTGPARFLPTRVTILLVMDPRRRVFAAYPPSANPVLCIGQGCYVSGGAGAPAEYMPRFSALGPANSIGRRAGPCRNQLTCVFRDVELGGGYGQIQPVDMGLLHHDRREIRGVRPDPTCDLISGRLFCAEPTVAKGYRAWIVPEVIATEAGAEALREALALGLPTVRSAEADPWHVRVHAESSR
jgi:hypothetical protein